MDIKDFLKINDFTQFKNNKKIKIENEEEIYSYFKIEYNSRIKPFYHLNPLYNTILNSNQFQYMIINFDNDSVAIFYKIIQIMKLKQIRIIGNAISINNIKTNVNIVEEKLNTLNFVRIVKMYKEKEYNPIEEYNDYFYDFSKHKFNGQYKSKCGLNKILNDDDFKIKVLNNVEENYISNLRNSWVEGMNEIGSIVTNKNTKDFYKIVGYNNKNNINIVIEYKNKPISIQNILINQKLKYADCLYINHLGRTNSNDSKLNLALKNMTKIQNYFAYEVLKEQGISMLYIAGCRPKEKRLLKHKEMFSDGCIQYYIK